MRSAGEAGCRGRGPGIERLKTREESVFFFFFPSSFSSRVFLVFSRICPSVFFGFLRVFLGFFFFFVIFFNFSRVFSGPSRVLLGFSFFFLVSLFWRC